MAEFFYVVCVETDTREHADQVMAERIHYEEQYADENNLQFDYGIDFTPGAGIGLESDTRDWHPGWG